jgi:hypothetical protein
MEALTSTKSAKPITAIIFLIFFTKEVSRIKGKIREAIGNGKLVSLGQ